MLIMVKRGLLEVKSITVKPKVRYADANGDMRLPDGYAVYADEWAIREFDRVDDAIEIIKKASEYAKDGKLIDFTEILKI